MVRLALLTLAALAAPASAATVEVISGTGVRGVTIASAGPVGQSFVAADSLLDSFGFQFTALNPSRANDAIRFEIREGTGASGALVHASSFTLPLSINSRTPVWYDIALPGVALTVGATYSALLTTVASARNAVVFGPDINIRTGAVLGPDAYAGGRFLFTGAVGGRICEGTASICDANFRMTGRTPAAAVPEPATWAMMIGGFCLVGGAMRRRAVAVA